MEILISVLASVVGDVIAYYIIKWLNKKFVGNQPKD